MRKIIFAVILIVCSHVSAETVLTKPSILNLGQVELLPSRPEKHIVVPGDTFLDIVGLFVADPIAASQIWGQNLPEVFPGDVVTLVTQGGVPALQVKRGRLVKLSPGIRVLKQEHKIPVIPTEKIQQFLNRPRIVTQDEIELAGYIIANAEQKLLSSIGDDIYVRGLDEFSDEQEYIIVREGTAYHTKDSDEILAYEAIYLGDAKVKQSGDPTTLLITAADREIRNGDHLLPLGERSFNEDFYPHAPLFLDEDAQIIAVVDGVSRIGQYQVVVLNKGTEDDMEIGHIVAIENRNVDEVEDKIADETVEIPNRRAGIAMVFKPFDRVSYALIMKATLPIRLFDKVTIP